MKKKVLRQFNDHGGRRGNTVRIITRWRRSVAPHEALVVLYWAMRSESQRHIRMVIEIAGEPSVFFSSSTGEYSSRRTISRLIYCFKQNQATAPSRSPSCGSPACYIGRIGLIHSVGGTNGSPWWGWWGVVLCFKKRKKNVLFLHSYSTER